MIQAVSKASLSIVPFADEHLDGAAALLAERHRAQRLVEPGLDPAYEEAAAARAEVDALWRADGASGAAALAGDDLVGFLVGRPREASWGPNVWVDPAGHAVARAELVRDLYAAAAERWVDEGLTSHYAVVPATDPALVDAWFRLGFGHQHVHAIRYCTDLVCGTCCLLHACQVRSDKGRVNTRFRGPSNVHFCHCTPIRTASCPDDVPTPCRKALGGLLPDP